MKLYICGPMTGYTRFNYPAFDEAAESLQGKGYEIGNLAEGGLCEGWHREDYLRRALRLLLECDGLAHLDGWVHSTGAVLETNIALALNMPTGHLASWLERE